MKKNPQLVSIKNTLCNRFDIFFRGITINNRANKGEEGLSVKKQICYVLAITMLSTNMVFAAWSAQSAKSVYEQYGGNAVSSAADWDYTRRGDEI